MWIPSESMQNATPDTIVKVPEGPPPKKENMGLASYVETQNKHFVRSAKERAEALRDIMGSEPAISDSTYTTYANVLAKEFIALENLSDNLTPEEGRNLPEWQALFTENFRQAFNEKYPNYALNKKDRDEKFAAYFSTFQDLLRSKDPEKADQWIAAATLATKRQMLALQVATGAHIDVIREAQEVGHISEVEVMSAVLSQESGVPIHKLRKDIQELSRTQNGGETNNWFKRLRARVGENTQNFLQWVLLERFEPGKKINLQDEEELTRMMDLYRKEARKRLHSDVKVSFKTDSFDPRRSYFFTDVSGNEQRRQLDAVQQEYLKNLTFNSKVEAGDGPGMLADREADRLLKKMIYAQQNTYYAKYDTQLRTEDQLNLVDEVKGKLYLINSNNNVHSGIGDRAMPIGLNETGYSLRDQLTVVMREINTGVKEKLREQAVTGEITNTVTEQISKLETAVAESKLSPADEKAKKDAEAVAAEKTGDLQTIADFQRLQGEIQEAERNKRQKQVEMAPATALRIDITTKEGIKSTYEVDLKQINREIDGKNNAIKNYEDQKIQLRTEISALEQQIRELDVKHNADSPRLDDLRTTIIPDLERTLRGLATTDPTYQATVTELQQRRAEEAIIASREGAYTTNKAYLDGEKRRKIGQIGTQTPYTGIELQIKDLQDEISNPATGLEKRKADKQAQIDAVTAEIDDLKKQLDLYQEGLTELQTLTKVEADKRAQLNAVFQLIQDKYATVAAIADINDAFIQGVQNELKAQKDIIDKLEGGKGIETAINKHQLEVLQAYQKHFLTAENWSRIQNRARDELKGVLEDKKLGDKDALTQLELFRRRRGNQHILPAYARTIQIMGGDEALSSTAEGVQIYKEIATVVTPELFFNKFKEQYGTELAALLGVTRLPTDLTVYDSRLNDPDIAHFMMRRVNRQFINEILSETMKQAQASELGRIRAADVPKLQDIVFMEQAMGNEGMEKTQQEKDREVKEAQYNFEFVSDERRRQFVREAEHFVSITPRLTAADTEKVVRAIRRVALEAPIRKLSLTRAEYATIQTKVDQEFAREGLPATLTVDQKRNLVNHIVPLQLSEEDVRSVAELNRLDTVDNVLDRAGFNGLLLLPPNIIRNLTRDVRNKMLELNIQNTVPLTDAVLDRSIGGQTVENILRQTITDATGAGVLPGGFNRDRLKEVVNRVNYRTQASREQARVVTKFSKEFMQHDGSLRDGILLHLLAAELDIDSAKALEKALYEVDNLKLPHQMGTLLDQLPREYKEYIIAHKNILTGRILNIYQRRTGRRATFDTMTDAEIEQYANLALRSLRGTIAIRARRGLRPLPAMERSVDAEGTNYDSLLKVHLERARIDKDVDAFNQTFWGLQGRELVAAIERELGGPAHRGEAIRYARAVEQERKKI